MSQGPENPFGNNPYQPSQHVGLTPTSTQTEGDATGGVIPYKNAPALLAYYLGIFSLLPCIGLFLAIPALIFGIIGLRQRAKNPAIKGSVHAWIGIVLGGIFTLVWGGLLTISLVAAVFG